MCPVAFRLIAWGSFALWFDCSVARMLPFDCAAGIAAILQRRIHLVAADSSDSSDDGWSDDD